MNNNQIIDVLRLALEEGRLTGSIGFDDDIEVSLIEAIKKIRISSEKYKWHDLRNNPDDLPKDFEDVLIFVEDDYCEIGYYSHCTECFKAGEYYYLISNKEYAFTCRAIAWKYIEPFNDER